MDALVHLKPKASVCANLLAVLDGQMNRKASYFGGRGQSPLVRYASLTTGRAGCFLAIARAPSRVACPSPTPSTMKTTPQRCETTRRIAVAVHDLDR
jgi:hypothetical protein